MAITIPVYSTREEVKSALDFKTTLRSDAQVDRAIQAAAEDIHGILHRRFYPEDGTKFWDWPNYQYAYPWRVWFGPYDLVTATQVTTGGVTIPLNQIFFEPANKEQNEPYTYLELNRSTSAGFGVGPTPQHDIAITGTWGYSATTTPAGTVAASCSSSVTTITVSDSSQTGVGAILLLGTERLLVTDRVMTTTGQTLQADLAAQANAVTVAVGDGTQFSYGEMLLIDSERVLITDIAGNNLTVKRSWDGTVLAAHDSGATVYAPRLLTVARGALGTSAASHIQGDTVARFTFAPLVSELSVGLALNTILQETSGYSRTIGGGDTERNASGAGLANLVANAVQRYGRKARMAAI